MQEPYHQAGSARILVVDDEEVICDILKDFLEYEGFKVAACTNAEDAIVELGREPFDLVLTDLKMPGIGGLELLHHIAESPGDTVTIIMTGYGTVESAIEAMKRGAFDYILKPFKPEEVVQVLRRALQKQKLERENFELRESLGLFELSEALSSSMPLNDQLEMIIGLVTENFGATAVEIVVENSKNAGAFETKVGRGPTGFAPRLPELIETFAFGNRVLVHGSEINSWVQNPNADGEPVASFMSAALKIRGAPFGVLNAYACGSHRFTEGQRKALAVFASRAANAIDTARMYTNLAETFTQTMQGFARALEAKDKYTHGHSDRVAMYGRRIAETLGLPDKDCDRIEHGGLMHDIGKIGIRASELNKPQKLTPEQYAMFKSHPVLGKRIIEPITFLVPLIPCVFYHHETWDGTGYPTGIGSTDIPLDARILAVADSYDAMTSDRPYRKALPHDIAVAELKRCSGRQFDPDAVEAFMTFIETFRTQRKSEGLPIPE